MQQRIFNICRNILNNSLDIKQNEKILIITDDGKVNLADHFFESAKKLKYEVTILKMITRDKSGEEPPNVVALTMQEVDVCICVTTFSLTHTHAKREAVKHGTRIATMPGITMDMLLEGAITANYSKVKEITEVVQGILSEGKSVKIENQGKSLSFLIDKREGIASTGVYKNAGESGNLPSGEAYIAPIEGTANGELIIDGSISGLGKLKEPIVIKVKDGQIYEATKNEGAFLLEKLHDDRGKTLAEFGIGTNKEARITGITLEDEKVYGTSHVAFGSNYTFGGENKANVHIDLVMLAPNIYIDEQLIIKDGNPLF